MVHSSLEAGRGGEDEEGEGEEVEKGRAASPNRHGRLAQNRLGAFFPEGRDRAGLLARKRRGLGPSGEWWRPVHSALALHRLCVKVHSHLFIVGAVPGVLSREQEDEKKNAWSRPLSCTTKSSSCPTEAFANPLVRSGCDTCHWRHSSPTGANDPLRDLQYPPALSTAMGPGVPHASPNTSSEYNARGA